MIRSMQGIAYSMKLQTDRMNVIASNIANIETRAYKKEVTNSKSFNDVMVQAIQYNSGETVTNNLAPMSFGVQLDEKRTIFEQGYISKTDFNTDFGLQGDGFFVLDTPNGMKYTRAGNFKFDQDGFLITQDGDYVMGEKGRIQVPDKKLNVDYKGNISNNDAIINKFRIVSFNDFKLLKREDGGNYSSDVQNIKKPMKTDVIQGFIESSNVDIVEETRNMMESKRNFESGQQIIKMLDDTLGKAANDIGRL